MSAQLAASTATPVSNRPLTLDKQLHARLPLRLEIVVEWTYRVPLVNMSQLKRGDLIRLDDDVTGFSPDAPQRARLYVVIVVAAQRFRVVPAVLEAVEGIDAEMVVGTDEPSVFVPWSTTIGLREVERASIVGQLRSDVVELVVDLLLGRRRV